jgi:hypothetical protein
VADLEGGAHAIDVGVDEGTGGAHLHAVKVASAIEDVVIAFRVAKRFQDGEAHSHCFVDEPRLRNLAFALGIPHTACFLPKIGKGAGPEGACASGISTLKFSISYWNGQIILFFWAFVSLECGT